MYTATLAIDNVLHPTAVNLQAEMTARELIEAAFVQLQTPQVTDPFTITIDYYGYDYYGQVTTYLGYFIVSIAQGANKYVSNANNYWELFVNGTLSAEGMDSVLVEPNDQIELRWITAPAAGEPAATKFQRILTRRSADLPSAASVTE